MKARGFLTDAMETHEGQPKHSQKERRNDDVKPRTTRSRSGKDRHVRGWDARWIEMSPSSTRTLKGFFRPGRCKERGPGQKGRYSRRFFTTKGKRVMASNPTPKQPRQPKDFPSALSIRHERQWRRARELGHSLRLTCTKTSSTHYSMPRGASSPWHLLPSAVGANGHPFPCRSLQLVWRQAPSHLLCLRGGRWDSQRSSHQ